MEDNRIEMEQLRLQVIQMAMEISSLRMTVEELAAGGEDGRANRLHHPVDELVSVKDGDKSSFIGEDNSHGVIRSGDGSISKTRVAPGGGVAPYVDLRVSYGDFDPPDYPDPLDPEYPGVPDTVKVDGPSGGIFDLPKPSKPAVLVWDKPGGVHWAEVDYTAQGVYRKGSDDDDTDTMEGGWAEFRNP